MRALRGPSLQNLVDILAVIADFQNAALEARAAAFLANEFDVREKLHFHGDRAVALTSFAAASRNIEGKMTGGVAAAFESGVSAKTSRIASKALR